MQLASDVGRREQLGQFRPIFPSLAKHQMHKINYGSVFGNFQWNATAEVSDELIALLAPLGALQIAQRSPSTAAEKAMAGYDKRPKGFQRTSILFSEGDAETLRKSLSKLTFKVGEGDAAKEYSFNADVAVEQYVPTEADVKMADERAAYARRGKAGELAELAEKVNFDGEVGDGTSENAPVDFLRAIRAWSKAQVAAI